jgi:hypothetical protein
MLEKGLLTQGAVSTEAVDIAIKNKMKRELIEHHKTRARENSKFNKIRWT